MKKTAHIIAITSKAIFILALLTLALTVCSFADEAGTCGSDLTWQFTASTGILKISGTGEMFDYSESSVPWSEHEYDIESVIIDDCVTSISGLAFAYCTALESVIIPDSVDSIGANAFNSCTSLKSIVIPYGVASIDMGMFNYCTSLESVTIPNSVASIDEWAFGNCTSLTSIIIPDSVSSIGAAAFYNCSALTSITIPNSVTSIGSGAFSVCTSLISVTIPNGVTSIDNNTFAGCTALTDVTIPDTVTSIGVNAFSGCTSLSSIEIPDSVTSIGESAFYGCTALTSAAIPDSVTSIGNYTFCSCTALTSITIPGAVASIGEYAFADINNLSDVYYKGTQMMWDNINISSSNTSLLSTSIHFMNNYGTCGENLTWKLDSNGVLTISGIGAMEDYTDSLPAPWYLYKDQINSVSIDEGVTSIGENAFAGCGNLTDIYYDGTAEQWDNISIGSNGLSPNTELHVKKSIIEQLFEAILSDSETSYSEELDFQYDGKINILDLIKYAKSFF